jgi:hypothetical protein
MGRLMQGIHARIKNGSKTNIGSGQFFEDKEPGMFDDTLGDHWDTMTSGGKRANWASTGTGNWNWQDPTGKQPEPPAQPHPLDM